MILLTETKTGTVWNARKTAGGAEGKPRAYWIAYHSGPSSSAQPGVVGFYAYSVSVAERMLGECTRLDC